MERRTYSIFWYYRVEDVRDAVESEPSVDVVVALFKAIM